VRNALSSELLKLRTTRTFFALTLSAVLLIGGISALGAALGSWRGGVQPGYDLVGIATFVELFTLVLGVLAVSTEFRHGTITPTLLTVPSRGRVIAAKLLAHMLAGLVLGLLVVLLNIVLVEAILSIRGVESGTSIGDALGWAASYGAAGALFAGIGVGVGTIVRNQVGALVGALTWLFVAESLLALVPGVRDAIATYGLAALSTGLTAPADGDADALAQVPAGLVLVGYAVLLAAAGAVLLRRRDVTT
jgi:ABC-2 type transport system permease protein